MTNGYASRAFAQAVESVFGDPPAGGGESGLRHAGAGSVLAEAGELYIKEFSSDRVIPAGIYVRFAHYTTDSVAGFVR